MRIRLCTTHTQIVVPGDDPAFCAYGEGRWQAMTCEIKDADIVMPDYPALVVESDSTVKWLKSGMKAPSGRYVLTEEYA